MQEYRQDAEGTNKTNQEQIALKERAFECSPISKLIANDILGYIPTQEQTSEETTNRQENLSCDKVENIKQRLPIELQVIHISQ